jgi:hypothetical protein
LGGFGAFEEDFVVGDRGVEGRDELEEIGLAFEEVREEIGVVRGQGAELVEEGCLARWPPVEREFLELNFVMSKYFLRIF